MRKLLFLTLAALLFMAVVAAPPVMAAGTPLGTAIVNKATGTYNDANGNAMTPVESNTVSMLVQQVFAVSITPTSAASSGALNTNVYYYGRLYNNGNGPDTQTFSFTTEAGSTFTPDAMTVYLDNGTSPGVWDAGDTVLGTGTNSVGSLTTASIVADGYYAIIVAVHIPTSASNGQTTGTRLTTTSVGDGTKTATGVATTSVSAAVIEMAKSHTAPSGYKPGDVITWQVRMTNTGSDYAWISSAGDTMPTNVTYLPNSIRVRDPLGNWTTRSDTCENTLADPSCYDAGNRRIVINPGAGNYLPLPGGGNLYYIVEIKATINADVPAGTTINNYGQVTFRPGTSSGPTSDPITSDSPQDSFIVTQKAGVDLIAVSTNKSGNPSDQIVYSFTAQNTGNGDDRINMTTNSSATWPWKLYRDLGVIGTYEPGTDTLLVDTNADSIIDTGLLTQNQVVNLLAVATIPANAPNNATDTVTVAGTTVFTPAATDSVQWTTTVKAPILGLVKEVISIVNIAELGGTCTPDVTSSGVPCKIYPGSVITYRVTATNSGNGDAKSVIISDAVPVNTTYSTGTIFTGSNASSLLLQTDAAGDDYARYESGYVISGAAGGSFAVNLGPAATWVMQFKVTVD